ncbi:MAG: mechanosensitive ion channel [Pseudomonadales bacterium]|nr:mechanosensitive ion channel [Pseudomonadales bacterium]
MDMLQQHSEKIIELLLTYGPKFLLAVIVLIVGLWVIKKVVGLMNATMTKKEVELTLKSFLMSLTGILLKALLLISVASMVGIETTSFIAILGAAGLAIGLALQGSLSNFAGGVLLLFFKPYKVGDFIEIQGHAGTVHSIQIFTTMLKTGDNKTIIIPNGPIANGSIINFSAEPTRRVDMVFGIGYDDDIDKAKGILNRLIEADSRILKEPAAAILLGELADSSVNFNVRVWVNAADYWGVFFGMQEAVKKAFDAEGVSIPYPQRDVHLHQVAAG